MNRKPIFDAAKKLGAKFETDADVKLMDQAIDDAVSDAIVITAPAAPAGMVMSAKGKGLVKSFEGCSLHAYPDPGSRDGNPWTIGWGATGPGITRGTVWTQAQADDRFERDCAQMAAGVNHLLAGAPTNQNQFDALCSLAFNIGLDDDADNIVEGLGDSSLLKAHKAGNFALAQSKFIAWRFNDGKEMKGLVRRRNAEAALYGEPV